MKSVLNMIFSTKMTIFLMLIFASSIAAATFIEDRFDTITAKILIYDAKWFELVYLLLILNFIGNIKRYNLLRWEKIPGLIFHLAFILMIIGAGITRYIGITGTMHIRESELSDVIYTSDPYLQISVPEKGNKYEYNRLMYLSAITNNSFHKKVNFLEYGPVDIRYKKFIRAANENGLDALILDINFNGISKEVNISGGMGYLSRFREVDFNGAKLNIAYGSKAIQLPFSLYLDNFILERYAGSMSPSSYASEVRVIDKRNNYQADHRIFMNNVLDYNGYRFFQSSYDEDERGTILSVNHDFIGTWVSYSSYFLLALGFFFTLFNKNSRFLIIRKSIWELRLRRKSAVMTGILIVGMNTAVFSQNHVHQPVNQNHAAEFGHLIVQTYNGRFEPLNTLAYDVLHKISRKDKFDMPGKGRMECMQVFIDMMLDQEYWKQQKLIYIREKSVRNVLGIDDKYVSFYDFFDKESNYKLTNYIETAFRKNQSEQNKFDKEIIKVDERVNICMMLFNGSLLKIFPEPGSINNTWISIADSVSNIPLTGMVNVINEDLKLPVFSYNTIMSAYFLSLATASQTGDYFRADKILKYMESIQRNSSAAELLPSQSKVDFEIKYNNAKIFINLKKIYGLLSLVLLVLAFVENLRTKRSRILNLVLNFFVLLLAAAFVYHSYGLGLRWYLSGHAPWSNGYEALILIGWGGLLAGFSFIKYSKITLAATALLAFFVLMTAGHSSYDPQLTNLQPVLKSYWLIIHVAVITISYGFLGLGFILGMFNLFIYLFRTDKNGVRLDLISEELTYINEMNLQIGLVLATMGTFLGGVWANESWGRYWGWDAKETWALIIIITYAIILHFRLVPKLKSAYFFNVGSVLGFGSVIMTFVGVNYYLSKGLHSYAADETPVFPAWAWGMILSVILLIILAGIKDRSVKRSNTGK